MFTNNTLTGLEKAYHSSEMFRVNNRLSNFANKTTKTQVKRLAERLYEDNRWLSRKTNDSVHRNCFTGIPMSTKYGGNSNRKMSVSLHINDNGSSRVLFYHEYVLQNNSKFRDDMELIKNKFGGELKHNKKDSTFKFSSIEDGIDFMKKATDEYKVMGG